MLGLQRKKSEDELKKEAAEQIIKNMTELHSSIFSNAIKYANAMIFAGYAGIFAIWSFTKDDLDYFKSGLVGILLIISICTFVVYEIYKMLTTLGLQLGFLGKIYKRQDPDSLFNAMQDLQDKEKVTIILNIKVWFGCFIVTVLTGFGAGGILLWSLIESVVRK